MSDAPIWKFRQMNPGEMNIDPIEAEFFSTEALGSLADAFVREAIQNSLDARRNGEKLRIRILFPAPLAMPGQKEKAHYMTGLLEHFSASRSGIARPPTPEEPLEFMLIEDFGTRGLQGDPLQSEDAELDSAGLRNDFYYFWRNIGRSRKEASELGRWGLGKTVFPAASRVNAFFGLTVRADDRCRFLMGQSVLKIHKLDGKRFYPYGYFGRFDGEFAVPVEAPGLLDRFCRDFQLARDGEPGLSVVIPYPDPELTPQAIVPSIVRHYFTPIVGGDLVVEVVHDGLTQSLDATTLPKLLAEASWDDAYTYRRLVELAQWGLSLAQDKYATSSAPLESNAPRWTNECFSTDAFSGLRERLNSGQRIAVTVPVWVKPMSADATLSRFDVYLERDDTLDGADEHFVRDGITIAGVRASLQKGVRALVTVRDRPLSQLLGDSENPAHTEWQERSPKFKDRYRHGPYTLRYIKNAPREIVRILTRLAEGRDFKLLQHLFSLDVPTEEQVEDPKKGHEEKPGAEATAAPGELETVGKDRFFHLQKLRGGFRISGNGNAKAMPRNAAVSVAYELRRGNPFSQYQPPDFELDKSPIQVSTVAADVAQKQRNLLVLRIQKPDFQVTVKGFDVRRDIRVRVLSIDGEVGP
jgi:hypothetical protein